MELKIFMSLWGFLWYLLEGIEVYEVNIYSQLSAQF